MVFIIVLMLAILSQLLWGVNAELSVTSVLHE